MVDTARLNRADHMDRAGSSPVEGTIYYYELE